MEHRKTLVNLKNINS